jgi:hypothetical protein
MRPTRHIQRSCTIAPKHISEIGVTLEGSGHEVKKKAPWGRHGREKRLQAAKRLAPTLTLTAMSRANMQVPHPFWQAARPLDQPALPRYCPHLHSHSYPNPRHTPQMVHAHACPLSIHTTASCANERDASEPAGRLLTTPRRTSRPAAPLCCSPPRSACTRPARPSGTPSRRASTRRAP